MRSNEQYTTTHADEGSDVAVHMEVVSAPQTEAWESVESVHAGRRAPTGLSGDGSGGTSSNSITTGGGGGIAPQAVLSACGRKVLERITWVEPRLVRVRI